MREERKKEKKARMPGKTVKVKGGGGGRDSKSAYGRQKGT